MAKPLWLQIDVNPFEHERCFSINTLALKLLSLPSLTLVTASTSRTVALAIASRFSSPVKSSTPPRYSSASDWNPISLCFRRRLSRRYPLKIWASHSSSRELEKDPGRSVLFSLMTGMSSATMARASSICLAARGSSLRWIEKMAFLASFWMSRERLMTFSRFWSYSPEWGRAGWGRVKGGGGR